MQSGGSEAVRQIGKSTGISVVFTLAAVLLFALCIRFFSIGSSVIMPVNQIIKLLAVFLGCFFGIKPGKAFFKGIASGLLSVLLTYFLFAALAGAISFGWGNVLDLIFGCLAGGISGIIAASAKTRG